MNSGKYLSRGYLWHKKKEYDKALTDYSEAIRLDPASAWAYKNRGSVWMAKSEYDKAISDYNEEIRLEPKNPWGHADRSVAWASKNERDKALTDINEAIRLNPEEGVFRGYRTKSGAQNRSTTRPSSNLARLSGSIRRTRPPSNAEAKPGNA